MKATQFPHALQKCCLPLRARTAGRCQSLLRFSSQSRQGTCLSAGRSHNLVLATATTGTKLISKAEIPAFIPRSDLASEMLRWANIDVGSSGFENFGMNMSVEPHYKEEKKGEKELWGFDAILLSEGREVNRIGVRLDDEIVVKHEFMGYGMDGFPQGQGRATDVKGKYFEIWKMDDNPVEPETREAIRAFCTGLSNAVQGYYSFGSCFTEDSL